MARGDDISPETILRAQAGDSAALDAVLQACQARLQAMASRLKHSRSGIEPLVNAGRYGVCKAVRNYDPSQGVFWTFAYRSVHGQMIDELAVQLGLSHDARKAYLEVRNTYLRLQQQAERTPRTADIVAATGVTPGVVEQIVRVLFQPAASLDALAERDWEWRPGTRAAEQEHWRPPDKWVMETDAAIDQRENIQAFCLLCLGPDEAARFLVLTILREDCGGYDYSWEEIAASLQGISAPPYPDWGATIEAEFTGWTCLPPTWAEVQALFLGRNPKPSAGYLRQRFSQARRCLVQRLPQGAPTTVILEQPYG